MAFLIFNVESFRRPDRGAQGRWNRIISPLRAGFPANFHFWVLIVPGIGKFK